MLPALFVSLIAYVEINFAILTATIKICPNLHVVANIAKKIEKSQFLLNNNWPFQIH